MASSIIWLVGILFEALVLYRGARAKLLSRYPNFYAYILSLFLADATFFLAHVTKFPIADKWSWYAGFLSLLLGCGIALEIFRHGLSPYAGAEKFARVASYTLLAAVMVFAVVYPIIAPSDGAARAIFTRAQQYFLAVQGVLLIVIIQVMAYYAIPAGRNLKGMMLGYGQAVAVTLALLAVRNYVGPSFQHAWTFTQQLSYLASLSIWLVALWSYIPNPVPKARIKSDDDYDGLASRTRGMVSAAGANLVKVERL
jgi:hypothetical protein